MKKKIKRELPHLWPICPKCGGICKVLNNYPTYSKWRKLIIRFLDWILPSPPKTFSEIKFEELKRNQEIVDRLYSMIQENAQLTSKNSLTIKNQRSLK